MPQSSNLQFFRPYSKKDVPVIIVFYMSFYYLSTRNHMILLMRRFYTIIAVAALLAYPARAQETRRTINVGGTNREMLVYIPQNLPDYAPLVISMHGMNQDAAYQRDMAHWAEVADTAKFAVVYPEGIDKSWDIGGDRDTKFIEAIIDYMFENHQINKNRVYLSGFSMGGMMTYHAVTIIPDKIAAMAPISGYNMGGAASCSRQIPVIHTHGTADDVVDYGGAEPYILKWVDIDGCDPTPVVQRPYKGKPNAELKTWKNYETGVEVALLTLDDKGHWVSMDASSVLTSCEIWNFCKRYTLDGPVEAVPPRLKKAEPADNSFDLPNSGILFKYQFDKPIRTDTVYANLEGGYARRCLFALEKGPSREITFALEAQDTIPSGEYRMTLENLVDTFGGVNKSCVFTYYIGSEDVQWPFVPDTLLSDGWLSQKDKGDDIVPDGWQFVIASGSRKEVFDENTQTSNGCCLKFFDTDGDMGAAFHLSACNYQTGTLSYGSYIGKRLHLTPGKYVLLFNSSYATQSAVNNAMKISVSLTTVTGKEVFVKEGVGSSCKRITSAGQKIEGSTRNALEFSVLSEGNYVLNFTAASAWQAVQIGNISIVSSPSVAQLNKGAFAEAYAAAEAECIGMEEMFGDYALSYVQALKEAVDSYRDFSATTTEAYGKVIAELDGLVQKAAMRKKALESFIEVRDRAAELVEQYGDNPDYADNRTLQTLQKRLEKYDTEFVNDADNSELSGAKSELGRWIDKFEGELATMVLKASDEPVSVVYYGLDGREEANPTKGIYICTKTYADGRRVTVKSVF